MCIRPAVVIVLASSVPVLGQVFSYECNSLPVDRGFTLVQAFCDPAEWIEGGRFFQHVEFCEGYDPPVGQMAAYRRSLADFDGQEEFFLEWRVQTDGDRSEIMACAPAVLVAADDGPAKYHFTIAADQVRLIRDLMLPIIYVDIDPEVTHTFRLEHYADYLYLWYIDGEVIDSGLPEGAYPSFDTRLLFGATAIYVESTTVWDYIRYGRIPVDASGDYDSDGDLGLDDFYFFHDYLSGPGTDAGPGGRFADMDFDTDVDLADLAAFQNAFSGSP